MFVLLERYFIYLINILKLKHKRITYGKDLCLNGIPVIAGNVSFGDNCRINSGMKFNPIGGDSKTILYAQEGKIQLGNNVGISNSALVSRCSIIIEDDVRIGGSCKIYDTDFHSLNLENRLKSHDQDIASKPVVIKRGAFIGAHSIILKGVTIGEEAVIGAGSVVTRSVPAGEIWAGNPAKYVKSVGGK